MLIRISNFVIKYHKMEGKEVDIDKAVIKGENMADKAMGKATIENPDGGNDTVVAAKATTVPTDDAAPMATETVTEEVMTDNDPEAPSNTGDVLATLNQISANLGTGTITEVPPEMEGVLSGIFDRLQTLYDLKNDPDFGDLLEQILMDKEAGSQGGVKQSIARAFDLNEMMELDAEGDEGFANAVNERRKEIEEDEASEAEKKKAWDDSIAQFAQYAESVGYDDAEKIDYMNYLGEYFRKFMNGTLTTEDFEKLDKARKYDDDVMTLKESMTPALDTVEVTPVPDIPDSGGVDVAMDKTPQQDNSAMGQLQTMLMQQR